MGIETKRISTFRLIEEIQSFNNAVVKDTKLTNGVRTLYFVASNFAYNGIVRMLKDDYQITDVSKLSQDLYVVTY